MVLNLNILKNCLIKSLLMEGLNGKNIELHATIIIKQNVIDDVLCQVHFPKNNTDEIELHFQPTESQLKMLMNPAVIDWTFSIKGEIDDVSKNLEMIIESENVYLKDDTFDSKNFIGTTKDLKITRNSNGEINKNIKGRFWITSNSLLQPALVGDPLVKENIARQFEFSPNEKLKFEFNINPSNYNNPEIETFSELVADFEILNEKIEKFDVKETLEILDDILLLASFASRKKCFCIKWEYSDSRTTITKYQNNVFIQSPRTTPEELIRLSDFREFISVAFPKFREYPRLAALRRALNFIVSSQNEYAESQFVSLFTALEMVILHYRKDNELEITLSEEEFKNFRKEIESCLQKITLEKFLKKEIEKLKEKLKIKNKDLNETAINSKVEDFVKGKRKFIRNKVMELNRVAFSDSLDRFFNNLGYSLDLKDLWEIKGSKIGLSGIRNTLVHGEHFTEEQDAALRYALYHLRWTVERIILAILGWSIDKSNVSPNYLSRGNIQYLKWKDKQDAFK